ncbi:sensor histidine kinase [Euzebya tangerina]|uniref:sensor histidine kinase n=1 Tax=Euzebya tangerina TaxID=591198 RepID=UPI000E30D4B2|nr:PAS domain-containing sensor histidine kinase [Euzebya tangerina]
MGRHTRAATAVGLTDQTSTRRLGSWGSVAFAFLVTVLGSINTLGLPEAFVWLSGLVWLPLTVWLLVKQDEAPTRAWPGHAAFVVDLVMVTAAVFLERGGAGTMWYLAIPLVLVTTYRRGLLGGAVLTGSIFVAAAATTPQGPSGADGERFIILAGVVSMLVLAAALVRGTLDRSAADVHNASSRSALITNYSTEAIVITDAEGVVVQVNPAARRLLFDDAPADAVVGTTCAEGLSFVTQSGAGLDCSGGCALAELCGGPTGSVELVQTLPGERRPMIGSAVMLPGQDGRTEYLHSFRDISKVKEADEAKTMFLATASHELKTPLTVIRGFTQLLQTRAEDPRDRTALDAIEARSRELSDIVDRLLLSSRIDAGRVELDLQPHDITALLRDRLADATHSLGRHITLVTREDIWATVSDTALVTVIDHLIDNAIKYSPDGGDVSVALSRSATKAIVRVTDQGIGMSPDQLDRCFEKFWQGEATDVRRFGGTGIGLYIVQSLVAAMRGTVRVESSRGAGTTFTIRLPLLPTPAPDGETPPTTIEGRSAPKAAVDEFIEQLGIGVGGRS